MDFLRILAIAIIAATAFILIAMPNNAVASEDATITVIVPTPHIPTRMTISHNLDGVFMINGEVENEVIIHRNYNDLYVCRNDRMFLIQFALKLKKHVWVTCTPWSNINGENK